MSLGTMAAESVRSVELVESTAFLESYRVASQAQSAEFYDLYSDRAVIHARAREHTQGIAFQGKAFKNWGRQILRAGPGSLDGSVFREATVEQRGNRLIIRAKRYSSTRCYWDPTYEVGIEKEGASYRVVEERLTTDPSATCSPGWAAPAGGRAGPAAAMEPAASPVIGPRLSLAEGSSWHPMSEQDVKLKAQQLARQIAAARVESPTGAVPVGPASTLLSSRPQAESATRMPARNRDLPSDLYVAPSE